MDHLITVLRWRQTAVGLMGRLTRGNEENLVEPKGLARLPRDGQVTIMHWVETAAEEAKAMGDRVLSAGC